ncbi:porin family protein [Dyadobacter sp. CY356]|uniref:porin family protein n=1 Tax=Dyadobacter sp. CY356 TaxID=2906442 RepID=UPI001F480340|nr:porin family protein [Dyadobacter sp. CY356]MCF0058079.1 PorT family protein [Dyadobacter sp. CY356]
MRSIKTTIYVTLLFLTTVISAQAQTKGFAFGIKGGVNLSKLTMGNVLTTRYDENGNAYKKFDGSDVRDNLKESLDTKTGMVGGVWMRFGKTIFVQPEVLVSTKGGSFNIIPDGSTTAQTVKIKYSNIDVPILIGLKGGPIRVLAGPLFSFRVGDNQKLSDAFKEYSSNRDGALSNAVVGYQFGAGLDLGSFSLDVRKEGTFTDLATFKLNNKPIDGSSATVRQKITSWQVTLGIKLF